MKLKQELYPDIEFDNRQDVIVIWQHDNDNSNRIKIQRENLTEFIKKVAELLRNG